MSLIAGGTDSVIWTAPADKANDKPLPGGFVAVVLAWFITPAMACVCAALLFTFTKVVVLKAKNPFKVSLFFYPLFTFITVWVVTYFVIQKGVNGWMKTKVYDSGSCPPGADWSKKNKNGSVTGCQIQDATNAWISAVTASVCTIAILIALKWIIKLIDRDLRLIEEQEAATIAHAQAHAAGTLEKGKVG
jgi:phosphate/sulfate permease